MEGLSSKLKNHLNKLKQSDEYCDKHQTWKVETTYGSVFCMACKKEEIDEETHKIAQESHESAMKHKTYGMLDRLSIFSDKTIKQASFENYEAETKEESTNKAHAQKLAEQYISGKNFNTLLTGNPGAGKSHLSMAMLKKINEESRPFKKCLFVSIDEVFRRIKNSFNTNSHFTESYAINLLREPDILVIDDLGSESGSIGNSQATEFTNRVLYSIINSRMGKSTITTTNLTNAQLSKKYDRKLLSRLYQGVKTNKSLIQFKETKDKRLDLDF